MSINLDKQEILKLNCEHTAIGFFTIRKVFGDFPAHMVDSRRGEYILDSSGNKQWKMYGYDIEFEKNPDGSYNFKKTSAFRLVDWNVWVTLPTRPYDLVIHTRRQAIRVPRVVMSLSYDDMPEIKFSLNADTMYDLYDGICAYSKRKIARHQGNLDHQVPKSKGGKKTWQNMRWCDKDLNTMKGNKWNHEVGLPWTEAKIPPDKLPIINFLKNKRGIPEWDFFLKPRDKVF